MQVGDALGNAGAGWTVPHDEKVYRARLVTQKVKDAFASWLAQRVIRQFLAAQEPGSAAHEEAVGLVADRVAEGRYGFHSDVAQRCLRTPEGVFHLACLLFDRENGDGSRRPVTEEEMVALLAEKGPEVNAVLRLVFARSFPKAPTPAPTKTDAAGQQEEGGAPDPNPRGPEGTSPRPQP